MRHLDENKLEAMHTAGEILEKKYGKIGTSSRDEFHDKSISWYYGEILKTRRQKLKMTQSQLAEKVGTARTYIARVEKGETDIQISSFFRIAHALGIEFTPKFKDTI
jgi:HTH-type transcriptional regulator/antitoxin HipB